MGRGHDANGNLLLGGQLALFAIVGRETMLTQIILDRHLRHGRNGLEGIRSNDGLFKRHT